MIIWILIGQNIWSEEKIEVIIINKYETFLIKETNYPY